MFLQEWQGQDNCIFRYGFKDIGHGYKVAIIQFIKGGWTTGEEKALKNLSSNISWHSLGEGFTWETQDRIRDEKLVQEAWQLAKKYIKKNLINLSFLMKLILLQNLVILHRRNNHFFKKLK